MVKVFTPDDQARIAAAIAMAERRTSGEIFCVFARQVSSYRDVSLGWAAASALILPMLLIPLNFDPAWFPGLGDSWEAAHLAAREVTIGKTLSAYAVVQAAIFASVLLITCIPAVQRLVIPRRVRRARVRRAALQQFLAHGLHTTRNRTGVLIFAALSDRQVEIVADEAIHSKVDAEVWAKAVDALTRSLRVGRAADGFETAIGLTGDVLATHFPPRTDNPDELPNRLVEI
ncbi:TPM domain-containing protein [Brevundimonas goettingensis]|uniref:TPM domain-containing protein n=1 Tax=Brevundimonas goettingensis TaxID=2774190 RepID=A0A975GWU4_9CAUL|nr:TPM domain-containing protein [Brevundimonas goettingensis]QTC92982.1 TPM domain-containing protein [Brevundimonas goettingensis]